MEIKTCSMAIATRAEYDQRDPGLIYVKAGRGRFAISLEEAKDLIGDLTDILDLASKWQADAAAAQNG
jgi:hypothetical protein